MFVFLLVCICNMVLWLCRYTHNTGPNVERFCFYPSGCLTNLRILPLFCWSASMFFLTICFPLRLRSDKEWKRLDRGTLNFVFWFCYHYSLCCSDQFSTREGRRTQQNGWSCNSWSRGNAGWHCRVVAERFPKKFKSNWAHYFSFLCEPLYTLAIHSCNMVSWLYTYNIL